MFVALASTVSQTQPKALSISDLKRNSAGPPNDDMGGRILDAYLNRVHLRYPFLDRADIIERHSNRFVQKNSTPKDQYGTFKIYMIVSYFLHYFSSYTRAYQSSLYVIRKLVNGSYLEHIRNYNLFDFY